MNVVNQKEGQFGGNLKNKLLNSFENRPIMIIGIMCLALTVSAVCIYFITRPTPVDPLQWLLDSCPPTVMSTDLIDGSDTHERYVYAYTRRGMLPLSRVRDELAVAGWREGDGKEAIAKNPRRSYPGFFDPGGVMAADLYMKSADGLIELWAFKTGSVFVRRRLSAQPGEPATGPAVESR